ncbi:UDP-glycosyltransferase [Flavobacterium sp. PL12]|uniref:UDP-glycosyltransferase n=1 Tax=Flavobacterium sp. PL12 TaxID=3071718 RepID=UPI00319EB0E5
MIKKILVVVDSINIEDSSGSKANVVFIQNLAEAGFEVLVYHYTRMNIKLKGVSCYSIPEIKYSPLYFLSRLQRVLQRHLKVNFNPYLEGFFGFSFTFFNDTKIISKALKKNIFLPDLILTLSKGASFRPHYAVLQIPEFHDKWMAYVHDPYPFHYYPRPYNWIEPGYKQKEDFFRKVSLKSSYSVFPSQLLKEWMGSYFPNFIKNGIVIPHQNGNYIIQDKSFPDYFDSSKFNILHAGNLMQERSPKGLIEGFMLFLKQNPEAKKESKLILVGNASDHSEMLKGYGNEPEIYIYNGNIAFDVAYNLQKNVSVNVILESKSEISPFLPAKFPHCVEANKKIISLAPYYSETRRLLGNDYPYWAEVDEVDKIAAIITSLFKLWKQNPVNFFLNREDLINYLSADYLKRTILDLKNIN